MSDELTDRDLEGGFGNSGWGEQETDRVGMERDDGGDQAGDIGGKALFACIAFALEGATLGLAAAAAYTMAVTDNGWEPRTLFGGGAAAGCMLLLAIFVPAIRSVVRSADRSARDKGSLLVGLGCIGVIGTLMGSGLTVAALANGTVTADEATRAWIPAAVESARSGAAAPPGPNGIDVPGALSMQLPRPFLNCGKGPISASALRPASAPSGMEAVTATLRREGCDKMAVSTTTWTLTRGIPRIIPGSLEIQGYVLKPGQDHPAGGSKQ